jgi:tripartite-type tricarboxylate transporter receptor subunit TctC
MVDRINAALVKAASAAKVKDRLVAAGFDMEPLTPPSQLAASVKEEFERNAAIVKQFNITLQ